MTTFSQLRNDVAGYLARSDLTLIIPTFVRMAEATINRELRTRQMITETVLTVTDGAVILPVDYLEAQTVEAMTSPRRVLEFTTLEQFKTLYGAANGAAPIHFAINGGHLQVGPSDGSDVRLTYYARIPALVGDDDTNWILTNHYDAYLYGALLEAAPYLMGDERIPVWGALLDRVLQGIRQDEQRAQYSGGVLVSQVNVSEAP